eukprot:533772-Prymnesium_polylepis.1
MLQVINEDAQNKQDRSEQSLSRSCAHNVTRDGTGGIVARCPSALRRAPRLSSCLISRHGAEDPEARGHQPRRGSRLHTAASASRGKWHGFCARQLIR